MQPNNNGGRHQIQSGRPPNPNQSQNQMNFTSPMNYGNGNNPMMYNMNNMMMYNNVNHMHNPGNQQVQVQSPILQQQQFGNFMGTQNNPMQPMNPISQQNNPMMRPQQPNNPHNNPMLRPQQPNNLHNDPMMRPQQPNNPQLNSMMRPQQQNIQNSQINNQFPPFNQINSQLNLMSPQQLQQMSPQQLQIAYMMQMNQLAQMQQLAQMNGLTSGLGTQPLSASTTNPIPVPLIPVPIPSVNEDDFDDDDFGDFSSANTNPFPQSNQPVVTSSVPLPLPETASSDPFEFGGFVGSEENVNTSPPNLNTKHTVVSEPVNSVAVDDDPDDDFGDFNSFNAPQPSPIPTSKTTISPESSPSNAPGTTFPASAPIDVFADCMPQPIKNISQAEDIFKAPFQNDQILSLPSLSHAAKESDILSQPVPVPAPDSSLDFFPPTASVTSTITVPHTKPVASMHPDSGADDDDFGDFSGAPAPSIPAQTSKDMGANMISFDDMSFGFEESGKTVNDKATLTSTHPTADDEDDFGDFDNAPTIAPVSTSVVSPITTLQQPPVEDDEDFGEFASVPVIAPVISTQPSLTEDDEWGDFNSFQGSSLPQIASVDQVPYIAPVTKSKADMFNDVFNNCGISTESNRTLSLPEITSDSPGTIPTGEKDLFVSADATGSAQQQPAELKPSPYSTDLTPSQMQNNELGSSIALPSASLDAFVDDEEEFAGFESYNANDAPAAAAIFTDPTFETQPDVFKPNPDSLPVDTSSSLEVIEPVQSESDVTINNHEFGDLDDFNDDDFGDFDSVPFSATTPAVIDTIPVQSNLAFSLPVRDVDKTEDDEEEFGSFDVAVTAVPDVSVPLSADNFVSSVESLDFTAVSTSDIKLKHESGQLQENVDINDNITESLEAENLQEEKVPQEPIVPVLKSEADLIGLWSMPAVDLKPTHQTEALDETVKAEHSDDENAAEEEREKQELAQAMAMSLGMTGGAGKTKTLDLGSIGGLKLDKLDIDIDLDLDLDNNMSGLIPFRRSQLGARPQPSDYQPQSILDVPFSELAVSVQSETTQSFRSCFGMLVTQERFAEALAVLEVLQTHNKIADLTEEKQPNEACLDQLYSSLPVFGITTKWLTVLKNDPSADVEEDSQFLYAHSEMTTALKTLLDQDQSYLSNQQQRQREKANLFITRYQNAFSNDVLTILPNKDQLYQETFAPDFIKRLQSAVTNALQTQRLANRDFRNIVGLTHMEGRGYPIIWLAVESYVHKHLKQCREFVNSLCSLQLNCLEPQVLQAEINAAETFLSGIKKLYQLIQRIWASAEELHVIFPSKYKDEICANWRAIAYLSSTQPQLAPLSFNKYFQDIPETEDISTNLTVQCLLCLREVDDDDTVCVELQTPEPERFKCHNTCAAICELSEVDLKDLPRFVISVMQSL